MFGSSRDDGLDIQNGLVKLVKIAQLKPRKNHTFRTNLGFKDDDLMLSIREFGVLEPIIVQPLDAGGYEILAGHRRTNAALLVGLTEIPAVIKDGLSEAEATIIETESNLLQRSWKDMSHSERAEVLNAHYNATNFRGVRNGFLDQISEEIKTLANPVKSMAEAGLSPVGTKSNLRQSGDAYELSKNTVSRYLRIYLLKRELKNRMDISWILQMQTG
jgi:ParB family chromosome partitioning protein